MLSGFDNLNMPEIKKTMKDGDIQDLSLACGNNKDAIATKQQSDTDTVTAETRFGIASLSKPVFAYLVLKLVGSNDFALNTKLNDIFPFKDFCKKFEYNWENSPDNIDRVNSFTPSMILSHQTGLPIGHGGSKPMEFDFDPATKKYAYSGIALMYLQQCIEEHFKMSLESLAKKHVFEPAGMKNSSFYPHFDLLSTSDRARKNGNIYLETSNHGLHYEIIQNGELKMNTIPWNQLPPNFPRTTADILSKKDELLSVILDQTSKAAHTPPANAANSMHTTASDYVRFCLDWMHNEDDKMKDAFTPKVSMNNDPWAVRTNVPQSDLDNVWWGHGWGLEKDDKTGKLYAFHTGDMNEWRAGVKLDLEEKTATVFLSKSNSQNGHLLQEKIFGENSHGLNFFFIKFDFARKVEELPHDWRVDPCWGAKHRPEKPQPVDTQSSLPQSNKPMESSVQDPAPQITSAVKPTMNSTGIFSGLAAAQAVPTMEYIKSVDEISSSPAQKLEQQQQEKAAKPAQVASQGQVSSSSTNPNQQEEKEQQTRSMPTPFHMTPTPPGTAKN